MLKRLNIFELICFLYIFEIIFVIQVFERPLLESLVLSVNEVDKIFVNWRDIIACNDNFLR